MYFRMIKLHITLVLVSLIFIVSVISEKLPQLDDKTKQSLEEGGKIIDEAIKTIENSGLVVSHLLKLLF